MKKPSLVYVYRPLELIGAIEAREKFGIKNATLFIHYYKADIDTHKFLLKQYPNWDEVIWLEFEGNEYGEKLVKFLKKFRKKEYQFLLTRAFKSASYFVHNLKYEKMFLLDDGSATINIYKDLVNEKRLTNRFHLFKGEENNRIRSKQKKIMLKYIFQGICISKPVDYVNFFTFYDIKSNENCTVVKNDFHWLNSFKKKNVNVKEGAVYFIGTNFINAGILNYYDYLQTLIKVKEKYKTKNIYYLPHPNEDEGFSKLLESGLGYKIRKNKINVELSFMIENEVPEIVAGTASTALTTVSSLYGDILSVEYFNINMDKITRRNRKNLESIYQYQEKMLKKITLSYD